MPPSTSATALGGTSAFTRSDFCKTTAAASAAAIVPGAAGVFASGTDAIGVGVRSVIASLGLAAKKGLAIVAGTQHRLQTLYIELMKRIHDGQIGEIVAAQCC